jgi:Mg-chelatase subunit ChlD
VRHVEREIDRCRTVTIVMTDGRRIYGSSRGGTWTDAEEDALRAAEAGQL